MGFAPSEGMLRFPTSYEIQRSFSADWKRLKDRDDHPDLIGLRQFVAAVDGHGA
jgi:hypothetical protein